MGFLENLRANREAQRLALIERMYKIYAKGVNGYDGNMSDAEILELQMFLQDPKNKLDFDNYARRRLNGVLYDGEDIVVTAPPQQNLSTELPLGYGDSDEDYWLGDVNGISEEELLALEGRAAEIEAQRRANAKKRNTAPRIRVYGVTSSKNGSKMEVLYAAKGAKTQLLNLLLLKFVVDLGFLSGAKSDLEAILTGTYVFELLRLNLPLQLLTLMLIWTEAENLQEGAGKQALLLTLQSNNTQTGSSQAFYPINGARTSYGQAYKVKLGAKMNYISALNGKCPEGYEIEKYITGGCVKCRRGKKLKEMFNKKKRFSKGNTITQTKHKDSAGARESYSDNSRTAYVNVLGNDSSFVSFRRNIGNNNNKITHVESDSKTARKNYYDFKKDYEELLKAKKHENGGLVDFLKCGRKTKRYIKGGAPDVQETNTTNNSKTKRTRLLDGNNWAIRDITAKGDTLHLSEVNGIREYDNDAKKRFEELLSKKKLELANKSVPSNRCGNRVKKHQGGGFFEWLKKWLDGSQPEVDPTMQNGYYSSDPYNGAVTLTLNGVRRTTRPMGGDESTLYETIYTGLNGVTSSRIDGLPFESETERHLFDSLQNVYDPSIKFKTQPRINMDHVKRQPKGEMLMRYKNPKKPYAQ